MILCSEGTVGTGKTVWSTWLGLCYYLDGFDVYSNYWLKIPHQKVQHAKKFIDIFSKNRLERNHSVFLGDELWSMIDSRDPKSVQAKFVNKILLASRKVNFSVIWNQQLNKLGDKRLRGITQYFAYPRIDEEEKICYVDIYDLAGNKTEIAFNYLPIVAYYDTYEIIDVDELNEEFKEIERSDYIKKANDTLLSLRKAGAFEEIKLNKQNIHSFLYEKGLDNSTLNNLVAIKFISVIG